MILSDSVSRRRFGVLALGGVAAPLVSGALVGRADARRTGPAVGPVAPRGSAHDGLPRALPEAKGVSSEAVLAFLDDVAAAGLELHSFMLARGGSVVAEGWWWPYQPQRIHMTHSLTKSVMVCGVALALDEKRFGLDDKVVSFFPEHVPADASDNLKAMTVRNLLTMQCGHDHETSGSVWRPIKTSWIAEFMKIPVPITPGTKMVYTSAASYMLSAIVTKTTGMKLADYIRPRLLDPMGITDFHWDVSPEGVTPGGNGLSWTTADSLKLGLLHAQKGLWKGKRLLSAEWVADATRHHTEDADGGYGYQWWMGPGKAYLGLGLFTQMSIVFPEHDAVLALFSAIDGSRKLKPLIWKHFPAAFVDATPATPASAALRKRTDSLRLLPTLAKTRSTRAASIAGRSFTLAANDQAAMAVKFDLAGDRIRYQLTDDRGTHAITAGLGEWLEQDTTMTGARLHHEYEPDTMRVVAGARWIDDDTLEMTWQFVEAAFRDTVICRFADGKVTVDRSVNLNSGELKLPTLSGTT
ncbi:MAG: Penicillin-binding protein beta-lactamase class [Sphingomonas bacterium]|uniref:serine hydrolase domain-containing protein n=1 Tax=Sphingomonas bacterium TaxID=1895847 RepID=UPI0026396D08|nr:serine hydrolase [Sphingomonas bacterium]MDB5707343.1 Penicillin-binding protein beta-lactamase class [Sphingomonas bacterium]